VVKATVIHIRHDDLGRVSYPACPDTSGGRTCNKKLVDAGGGGWQCAVHGIHVPVYRYMLSCQIADATGSEYITLFDAEATALLGIDANALQQKVAAGGGGGASMEEVNAYFVAAMYREFHFTTKARMEDRPGAESRVKVTCVKLREIDAARESKALLAAVKKFPA